MEGFRTGRMARLDVHLTLMYCEMTNLIQKGKGENYDIIRYLTVYQIRKQTVRIKEIKNDA